MQLYKADIYKLEPKDTIFYKGKKHTVESIRKDGQGIIQSITTNSHHLAGYNIYTTNKKKEAKNVQ